MVACAAQPRSLRSLAPPVEQALERVGLGGRGAEPVYRLSGGEQQRVALARLIVKRPSVVLADEPTGALDHGNADMVIESLQTMAADGCAVLIATHSEHVASACDYRISLARESAVASKPSSNRITGRYAATRLVLRCPAVQGREGKSDSTRRPIRLAAWSGAGRFESRHPPDLRC